MDRLWAPWRSKYIKQHKIRRTRACIFCLAPRKRRDAAQLIVHRSRHAFAILNIYPYNTGHIMVAPFRHVRDFTPLSGQERLDLINLQVRMQNVLVKVLKPHSFNTGSNMGGAAGAGFGNHLHIHIVPRWIGDVNFMPILGRTKVMSASLQEIHRRLKKAL